MPRDTEPGQPTSKKDQVKGGKWTKYVPEPRAGGLTWADISQPLIGEVVQAVTRGGDAILLGTTRDGGALVLTVCSGDQRVKFYSSTELEAAAMLQKVLNIAEE